MMGGRAQSAKQPTSGGETGRVGRLGGGDGGECVSRREHGHGRAANRQPAASRTTRRHGIASQG
jgi:hypothetical protein